MTAPISKSRHYLVCYCTLLLWWLVWIFLFFIALISLAIVNKLFDLKVYMPSMAFAVEFAAAAILSIVSSLYIAQLSYLRLRYSKLEILLVVAVTLTCLSIVSFPGTFQVTLSQW